MVCSHRKPVETALLNFEYWLQLSINQIQIFEANCWPIWHFEWCIISLKYCFQWHLYQRFYNEKRWKTKHVITIFLNVKTLYIYMYWIARTLSRHATHDSSGVSGDVIAYPSQRTLELVSCRNSCRCAVTSRRIEHAMTSRWKQLYADPPGNTRYEGYLVTVSGNISACIGALWRQTSTGPDLSVWRPWAGSLLEAPTHPQML